MSARCQSPALRWEFFGSLAPVSISARAGYTLIELVTVTALAITLAALATAGYHTWTRDTAIESGQRRLQASLIRARSFALARRVETRCVAILRDRAMARADAVAVEFRHSPTGSWWLVSETNSLPDWIGFRRDPELATNVLFRADGRCRRGDEPDNVETAGWLRLELVHTRIENPDDMRYHRALEINRLTGLVREVAP